MGKKMAKYHLPAAAAFHMFPKVSHTAREGNWGNAMQGLTGFVKRTSLRFLRDCSGPTAVEYAMLLALIVLVAAGAIKVIGQDWETAIFAQLAQAIPE